MKFKVEKIGCEMLHVYINDSWVGQFNIFKNEIHDIIDECVKYVFDRKIKITTIDLNANMKELNTKLVEIFNATKNKELKIMKVEVKMITTYIMEVVVGYWRDEYNINTMDDNSIFNNVIKKAIPCLPNRPYGLDLAKISQEISDKVTKVYYNHLYSVYRDTPKPSKSLTDFEVKLAELQKCIDVAKQDLIKGIEIYKLLHGIGANTSVWSNPFIVSKGGLTGTYNGSNVMNCNTNGSK